MSSEERSAGVHYKDEQAFWDAKGRVEYVSLSEFDQQRIRQWVGPLAGDACILDLGGGSGMMGRALGVADMSRIVCIDISLNMLRHSAGLAVQGDALCLPFLDRAFDVVIAAAFLHHVPGLENKVLQECSRVLKPGGKIFGYDPSASCIQNRVFMGRGSMRLKTFSPDEMPVRSTYLRECLETHGFDAGPVRHFSFRNARLTLFEVVQRWIIDPIAVGPLKPYLARWFFWSATRRS